MNKIAQLFDPTKDIHRTIEKVITYDKSQERRLKAEISEYIATKSIEEQFERLLSRMQTAMEHGGENEVGVWVSGFYGSGKSSFTKYFGLSFDDQVKIDGIAFKTHLQDRFHKAQTKALLATVTKRFPAAVVLLDLASEMLAGATMEDVSTVLFYKVLQFAGYSRNLKVAALERKLQKDGRYDEFKQKIQEDLGTGWSEIQNDPLVVDSIIPEIAHQMYPEIFKAPTSFNTSTSDFKPFENERVKEMLQIVRDATGNQHVIFIIDEVGQYIGSRSNLILNLDGLAKNLKQIGDGKVWIISTAQQTLTEDDPRAALNSPLLYKLKDRFPIQIDLESRDIKEICYKRLLGKSSDGISKLKSLFEQNGQKLRHNIKLQDARFYDSDFNEEAFTNLYPFLPAHFDILLHLLGALAKSTGGIGLRSAIKVVQDILIEKMNNQSPVADLPIGELVTTITLYDALEKDIRRAFPSIYQSLEKTLIQFHGSAIHENIGKTVAVLQILGNLPVTVQNVAGLMHPNITGASLKEEIELAVNDMISNSMAPFGEQEGNLCFFSEKLNDIEQERAQIPLRTIETRRIYNEVLKETFNPLPSIHLNGSFIVRTGLKSRSGTFVVNLLGERETIQTIVELCDPKDFESTRTSDVSESRLPSYRYTIFLIGKKEPEIEDKIAEIYRCKEICNRYRNEPDQEVKEYCSAQMDRSVKLTTKLGHTIKRCLSKGVLIYKGQATAVDTLDKNVVDACKKHLLDVANQVFDRYAEASHRAETILAEKFLKTENLAAITVKIDPLGLVQSQGGKPSIQTDHKALLSIRDYIDRNGTVEGKRLCEYFTGAPFGWSPDTLRYLVAAYLVAGEIKLKVSGREVKANGPLAIDALKSNNAFRAVGVSLREGKPSIELLAKAAERLTEIIGEPVHPLEQNISRAAAKHLPGFQTKFAPLGEKLYSLGLPGIERMHSLRKEISDVMFTDASDAPERLGAEQSSLFENLKWAGRVDQIFKQGLENSIKELQLHRREIKEMPESGVPGQLQQDLVDEMSLLKSLFVDDNFHTRITKLNSILTDIKAKVKHAVVRMREVQKRMIQDTKKDFSLIPEWSQLSSEEQSGVISTLENLLIDTDKTIFGLKKLIAQEFDIYSTIQELRKRIISMGKERAQKREEERREKARGENKYLKTLTIPNRIGSLQELNDLLKKLEQVRADSIKHDKFEINIVIEPSST
ncbi:MAG: BREX system P-loop protein BrxC [Desulfobacula sp.]|uniref:BREX system P-loop protein BrxC n=1 Tax=Desulfobacula sp. TaxID=2593537 RepID=UPI0025C0D036|nr:BREX system P-loop protein BrxC [Desulfobacula sp.]MCD4719518.1 BREX system P-loop protein BrxC [Desulfobacula sp.]